MWMGLRSRRGFIYPNDTFSGENGCSDPNLQVLAAVALPIPKELEALG